LILTFPFNPITPEFPCKSVPRP